MENEVTKAIKYRRSVRVYNNELELDSDKVQDCIKNAVLAPNSSNLQLWEFYHVTDKVVLKALSKACLNQNAAKTAKEMVVVVCRKDLWKSRRADNIKFLEETYNKPIKSYSKREKGSYNYYKIIIPFAYFDVFGILGFLKYCIIYFIGLFKPVIRQIKKSDIRVVVNKSAGLAAENFMISMASIGYDTCPMEGFDSVLVKRILKLPFSSEINMVIACGVRNDKEIYNKQFRVPFEKVYKKI